MYVWEIISNMKPYVYHLKEIYSKSLERLLRLLKLWGCG